jgi:hypothetical protein
VLQGRSLAEATTACFNGYVMRSDGAAIALRKLRPFDWGSHMDCFAALPFLHNHCIYE